ncbi:hypothetical protein F5146DRAFT_1125423 [Armillaria mellea]|nr:hypothetical protein F5146DRAFT_1125423 [Armillaria mellea]
MSAPIRRLPRDILLEIFSLSSSLNPDAGDYPWTLGHVCRWWRDIVHSSPPLWSFVVLCQPYDPEIIETQLQRSGNYVPLSVYISTHDRDRGTQNSAIVDRVMDLCHRWSKLELHTYAPLYADPSRHAEKLPLFLPKLLTLKAQGTWSNHMILVLDAPLLKTVQLDNDLSLQSIPRHITYLTLSGLSMKELPSLSSFRNLVELRFEAGSVDQSANHASTITHPTIRYLSVSGITMLPFLTLPALEHLRYVDTVRSNRVVSAFLSRSCCTLKPLAANMRYGDDWFLELLESQPSLSRLLVDPIGDFNHAVIRKLSSLEFLPNLEHLSFRHVNVEAVKMIRARWYAPMRRIRTFVIIDTASKEALMDSMQAMINEGLEVKAGEDLREMKLWFDP